MAVKTIRDLITASLRLINVVQANEVPTADDMNISLFALQALLDSWSTERLNIFLMKPYYFMVNAGQKDYLVGDGGDWNISRPMNIEKITLSYQGGLTATSNPFTLDTSTQVVGYFNDFGDDIYDEECFDPLGDSLGFIASTDPVGPQLTDPNGALVGYCTRTPNYTLIQSPGTLDIPLEKLTSMQYSAVALKNMQSTYPTKFYDNGAYPLRTVSVWPVPMNTNPVTVWSWEPLTDPENLDTPLNFPKGYERALRFSLAVELAPEFGKSVASEVTSIADASKATMRRLNSKSSILVGDLAIAVAQPGPYNYNLASTTPN